MKRLVYTFFMVLATISLSFAQTNFSVSVGGAGLSFSPANLTITAGDSVTWTNAGGFHNVNGSQAIYSSNPESFSNGGASSAGWTYGYRFNTPGTYDYQCDPHVGANMVGQIIVQAATLPLYDIATVHTEDVAGVADSLGVECELRGVVYSIDFDGNNGFSFYMQDPTGGINVFNFSDVSGYTVAIGDSIHATGEIDQFNGLTELFVDSIALISQNNFIALPEIVSTPDESTEGKYIKVEKVWLTDTAEWLGTGGSFNVNVTNGVDTFLLRVDGDTETADLPAPRFVDTLNVSGASAQFDNSAPRTEGYQIFPRFNSDIVFLNAECTPIYPISLVHTEDTAGVADSIGTVCELRGVVHSIDYDGNNGYSFYIADNTGFINVFDFNDVSGYQVTLGDSIHVIGDILQFNGLTEIGPDSIALISQGNALREPIVVTEFNEGNESFLATIENVFIVDPSDWNTSGSFNVDFTNGADTLTIRIDSDTDISGLPAPAVTDTFNFTGIITQFDNNGSPFLDRYQLLPRFQTDIDTISMGGPAPVDTIPVYTIGLVNTEDADGAADSLEVECELRAVVTSTDFRGGNGLTFTMEDPTGAISVFSFNDVSNYEVTIGDSIHAIGEIDQFNGLTQLNVDSIGLISQGNSVSDALVVTALDETTESVVVTLENVFIVDTAEWQTSGGSFNFRVFNAAQDTFTVRVDSDVTLFGTAAPGVNDTLTITGVGGQFDNSSPFTEGYQLLPRFTEDFVVDAFVTSVNPDLNTQIRVYPNPASDLLIVDADGLNLEAVRLVDMMGREVMKVMANQTRANMDVARLKAGVYTIIVETREGRAARQVMIRR
ncbi:MAG: plastocyanin/azurin family copper-binding protein [Bacteroidota bacterium]